MTSYPSVLMHQLNVVFVDHERNSLNTKSLMESCQYKVSHFQFAAAAIPMLTNGETKIDLIIANITSPDVFKLFEQAISIGIPTILMSCDEGMTSSATWAIEKGALLYIERPTSLEMLRYLWQLVVRETMRVLREEERLKAAAPPCEVGFKDVEDSNEVDNSRMSQGKLKRKKCTEWTEELHEKFVDAIEQLGDGNKNLSQKETLEKMNVHGLTKMQIASQFQRWGTPVAKSSVNSMSLGCVGSSDAIPKQICQVRKRQSKSSVNSMSLGCVRSNDASPMQMCQFRKRQLNPIEETTTEHTQEDPIEDVTTEPTQEGPIEETITEPTQEGPIEAPQEGPIEAPQEGPIEETLTKATQESPIAETAEAAGENQKPIA